MRKGLLALAAVVLLFTSAPGAQSGVDGNWALTFETPMGMLEASATFKSDGETLSGSIQSQAGATTLTGTIQGTEISFVINVPTPQGDMSIQLTGEVIGDEMKGSFDFGQGAGNWSGKRVP